MPHQESSFDDVAIARLKLAAEEVAWLTGRGYAIDLVGDIVARHHDLSDVHRLALARGTCSEPQYRRRAARELEAEDVARTPLAIDAIDVIATLEAALDGKPVLQTLDGTVRAFGIAPHAFAVRSRTHEAIGLLLGAVKVLRASVAKFYIDENAPAASELEACIADAGKAQKVKVETRTVAPVSAALRKERQIVTGEAEVLDGCAGWFNLAGRLVEGMSAARVVRLQ